MNFKTLLTTSLCLCAFSGLTTTISYAQTYPSKPIRLVVAYPPGGTTDLLARAVANALGANLKQTVVVENKPGAGGNIGATFVASATPDGYTLGLGSAGNLALNYLSYKNMPYDSLADFTPLSTLVTVPNVLAVSGESPAKTLPELERYLKNKQEEGFFGSTGTGNGPHLTGELFSQKTGLKLTHVPYQGGAPAITALLGGQVDLAFDNLTSMLPFIQSGKLRAIAVSSAKRSASLPDVPTLQEQGLKNFDVSAWFALMGPANIDQAKVKIIEDAVAKLKSDEKFIATLKSMAATPVLSNGEELEKLIRLERTRWPELMQQSKQN